MPALHALRGLVNGKHWAGLAEMLSGTFVWAFDRPIEHLSFVTLLAEVLADASEVRLLVLARLQRTSPLPHAEHAGASFRCCALWDTPGRWREHELDFELHLGTLNHDTTRLAYLGMTWHVEPAGNVA